MATTAPTVRSVNNGVITLADGTQVGGPQIPTPSNAFGLAPAAQLSPAGPQGLQGPAPTGGYGSRNNLGGWTGPADPAPNPDLKAGMEFGQAFERPSPHVATADHQYLDAFNSSMGEMRKSIDQQLISSMTGLGARRDAAAKVVAKVPQQVKDAYTQAETKTNAVDRGARAALGYDGPNTNRALYEASFSGAKATGAAIQPLLELGVQQNYDSGAAGLDAQHLAGTNQINSQQAQFSASMAGQQAGINASNAAAERERGWALDDRDFALLHPQLNPKSGPQVNPETQWYHEQTLLQNENKIAIGQGYSGAAEAAQAASDGARWVRELQSGNSSKDRRKAILARVDSDQNLATWFDSNFDLAPYR